MGCEQSVVAGGQEEVITAKGGGTKVLSGSSERVAEVIVEIPGAEVDVVSGGGKEGAIVARGPFRLLRLRPLDAADGPGKYVTIRPTKVGPEMVPGGGDGGTEIAEGTPVNVLEVVDVASHKRIRARVEDPPGWISLENTETKVRWARKLEVAAFQVACGDAESNSDFYYPMTLAVPVLLVFETRIITFDAGDGDSFAIRLPKNTPDEQVLELAGVLSSYCAFQLSKKKDVEDYVAGGASTLASAIGSGAVLLAKGLHKGADEAKKHVKPKEQEVEVSATTKIGMTATKHAAVGTVTVASAVMDGLLNTACYLGKEVGKEAVKKNGASAAPSSAEPPSASSKAGKAALAGGLIVFDALLKASDSLQTAAADETANMVGHKYGAAAGSVARDGLATAGAACELKDLVGKKAVGKLAVKATAYTAAGMMEGAAESSSKRSLT
jgi:hypothetical protein